MVASKSSNLDQRQVVVLGAGLAGLSAAYHLRPYGLNAAVIEKSPWVGGTARSVHINGFTFDITGHLLHLHYDYTRQLISKLLGDNVYNCVRKASIYSNQTFTPYPFQANTYGLPTKIVEECVTGFVDAVDRYAAPEDRSTSLAFDEWSTRTFGFGIHKHFMKPYNEKLWSVDLHTMTAEWCGMFVPQPKIDDVLRGSTQRIADNIGYNATFLYPKKGGIQVLAQALADGVDVHLNTSIEEVLWKQKKVRLSTGKCLHYNFLISSMPLVELLKRLHDVPPEISALIPELRWTSVICVNLGVDRSAISDMSWIYFPEKEFVFYRVGFPMNFTPHAVPQGCSSMYVEIAYSPDNALSASPLELQEKIRRDLERCNILRPSDKFVVADVVPIRYAYVIYTLNRARILDPIFDFLEANNILSVGRYGQWKYSFMEEAILDGKKAAEKILTGGK